MRSFNTPKRNADSGKTKSPALSQSCVIRERLSNAKHLAFFKFINEILRLRLRMT